MDGLLRGKRADGKRCSAGDDGDGAIAIGAEQADAVLIITFHDCLSGLAERIRCADGYDGDAGMHRSQEWRRGRCFASVMGNLQKFGR